MQCTSKTYPTSFVVTDPKGSILIECGKMLQKFGYRIRFLNTINMKKSMHYNPFAYIHSEKDILKLVTTLIANTKGEGKGGDDFWVKAETLLFTALIGYIHYEAPTEEQNFSTLLEMINAMEVREDDEEFENPVDLMFKELESRQPGHFAVRQYKKYKLAAGKTAKSILVAAAVRLAAFNLPQIAKITSHDDMDLYSLGKKNALCMRSSRTTTTPFTSWYPFYMLRRSKLCTIQRIRFIMEPCLAMCTLFWTNLLPCRSPAIRENSPPCEAATYPAAPLFKILPKSKNFTKTPGRPS